MKRLIIGDIHGCYTELIELITLAKLSPEDEIIALGDIVDRGPHSRNVLDFFKNQTKAQSLMGNHERKHILSLQGLTKPALSQLITHQQFGENNYINAINYIKTFPYFIELSEAILIHGYFEPNIPLLQQQEKVLVGSLSGEKYLKKKFPRPWYELYKGDKPVIAGHYDYLGNSKPLIHEDQVYCIDTGCCRGKALTGLILPDFQIISVSSHRNYWNEQKSKAIDLKISMFIEKPLSWDDIENLQSKHKNSEVKSKEIQEYISRRNKLIEKVKKTLKSIYDYILLENERILTYLEAKYSYSDLHLNEQGKTYASYIGKTPIASYLHLARKGKFTLEILRKRFKNIKDLMEFAKIVGVLNEFNHD